MAQIYNPRYRMVVLNLQFNLEKQKIKFIMLFDILKKWGSIVLKL